MMSVVKIINSKLLKTSIVYMLASAINNVIPFLLLPFLTRFLTPKDYGIVAMFSVLLNISNVLIGLNIYGAISREYFNSMINYKEFIANCIIIIFINLLLVSFSMVIFSNIISKTFHFPKAWLSVVILVAFFQLIILINLSIFQVQLKAKHYTLLQLSRSILDILLSIFFILFLKLSWKGKLLGNLFATTIVGVLSFIYLRKNWIHWKFNFKYIKTALQFGIPLVPHALSGMFMMSTDRYIIANLVGLSEAGLYTVGLQIGGVILILADSFNKAYAPWLFEKLNENKMKIKKKIVIFTYLYFVGIILISIVFSILAPFLINILVGKDFLSSIKVIFWISLGNAFDGMYFMVVNYIFYARKTNILAFITFTTSLINIPITYFFVKFFGFMGAAQSLMLTKFLTFLLTWILSAQVYKMPWFLIWKNPKHLISEVF